MMPDGRKQTPDDVRRMVGFVRGMYDRTAVACVMPVPVSLESPNAHLTDDERECFLKAEAV